MWKCCGKAQFPNCFAQFIRKLCCSTKFAHQWKWKWKGGSGPSALDADCCRKISTSNMFGTCTIDLRKALADFIRHICVSEVDIKDNKSSLESFLTCRLVPLDQSPALRPIGIGDFLKRIADKIANGSS